ncbi:hypothetical protein J6590_024852 [Homalodisca vitripennis]|nr:hypothetical protein J6590_024852 [Homalodisca vitripennis]
MFLRVYVSENIVSEGPALPVSRIGGISPFNWNTSSLFAPLLPCFQWPSRINDHLKETEFEVNVKPRDPKITSPPRYEKPMLSTPPAETKQRSLKNSSPVKSNASPPSRKSPPIKPPLEGPPTETAKIRKNPQSTSNSELITLKINELEI